MSLRVFPNKCHAHPRDTFLAMFGPPAGGAKNSRYRFLILARKPLDATRPNGTIPNNLQLALHCAPLRLFSKKRLFVTLWGRSPGVESLVSEILEWILELDSGMDCGMGSGMESGMDSRMDSGTDSGMDSGVDVG